MISEQVFYAIKGDTQPGVADLRYCTSRLSSVWYVAILATITRVQRVYSMPNVSRIL
jgi:hypothetical protein